ncbi:MAG TPA: hypothetical protein VK457_01740 [Chloroflexota bacterium]|nr:hypothetical protein [Chloroflexota bacterium]
MSAEFWAIVGSAITVLIAVGATNRRMDERFDHVNRRIDEMSARIDDLAQHVSRLAGRFEEMSRWSKDIVEALVHRTAA